MAAHSPAYKAFLKSTGPHSHLKLWADDYNLGALQALGKRERLEIEDHLCELLADEPEIRAVRALAVVTSEYAVPVLEACLVQWESHDRFVVETARALWLIQRDERSLGLLAGVLASGSDPDSRVLAAEYLADRPEPEAMRGLFEGLADEEKTVREAVVSALWKQLDLPSKYAPFSRLYELRAGLSTDDPLKRRKWRKTLGDYLRDRGLGEDMAAWTIG